MDPSSDCAQPPPDVHISKAKPERKRGAASWSGKVDVYKVYVRNPDARAIRYVRDWLHTLSDAEGESPIVYARFVGAEGMYEHDAEDPDRCLCALLHDRRFLQHVCGLCVEEMALHAGCFRSVVSAATAGEASLTKLHLRNCRLDAASALSLADALPRSKLLDLYVVGCPPETERALMAALADGRHHLKRLWLGLESATPEGVRNFTADLPLSRVRMLAVQDVGSAAVTGALLQHPERLRGIRHLYLHSCALSDSDLCAYLRHADCRARSLSMVSCTMEPEGYTRFIEAVKANGTIRRLVLAGANVPNTTLRSLIMATRDHETLRSLGVDFAQLGAMQ